MRRELVVPLQPAGVGVERDDRIGVEVVAGPLLGFQSGPGLPTPQYVRLSVGIVRAGHPDRAAAVLPRLGSQYVVGVRRARLPGLMPGFARPGNRVEAPDLLSRARVVGGDEAANAVLAAADADDDLVLDDERRQRHRVAGLAVGHLGLPQRPAASRVDARPGARRAWP